MRKKCVVILACRLFCVPFADHSRPMNNGQPLSNALKSGFAVVGGN